MKLRSAIFALVLLCAALVPCFAHHTAVIVNKENAVGNVTSTQLTKMIRGEVKKWPNGRGIILVLHKDSASEREALERLNKMSAAEWRAFVSAHRELIIFVDTDEQVLQAVQAEPGALGLISAHSINGSVNVIHVDGSLPMEVGYLPH